MRTHRETMTVDYRTKEIRPRRIYDVRLDPGSRDRPKSLESRESRERPGWCGMTQTPTREEIYDEAEEIVQRMIKRGVLAP